MNNIEFNILLDKVILPAIIKTRHQGGQEYARDDENIFANFERVSKTLDISPEEVIMTYTLKHIDGIVSHIKGQVSQREDVRGRITDAAVYLFLLWAYLVKDENNSTDVDENTNQTKVEPFSNNLSETEKDIQEILNQQTESREIDYAERVHIMNQKGKENDLITAEEITIKGSKDIIKMTGIPEFESVAYNPEDGPPPGAPLNTGCCGGGNNPKHTIEKKEDHLDRLATQNKYKNNELIKKSLAKRQKSKTKATQSDK